MRRLFETLTPTDQARNFSAISIGIASPDRITSWSYGEVRKPETINYRTFKPESEGLFCCKLFGPEKDFECLCGKYKRPKFRGTICEKCGVEVTLRRVRRERMAHIHLACPVAHIWFFKALPSKVGLALGLGLRDIERVLYFESYIVIDPGETELERKQLLTPEEYQEIRKQYSPAKVQIGIGAEGLRELLKDIDLDAEIIDLREQSTTTKSVMRKKKLLRRLGMLITLQKSEQRPEWMVLETLPVLPPDLRPLIPLDGGRFTTSDVNDLYRRVINRNNRLRRLMELSAPDIIINNEKRMLQEAVDSLIDNNRRGKVATNPSKRQLKSLADTVKGKSGRFRQNLLGKRVDFSGRSVIVVGPSLKLHQCGLPKEMALEMFKPFVLQRLLQTNIAPNIKVAKKMADTRDPQVWDVLAAVIHQHPVLLNRAPTLHRLGVQAFEPLLIQGKAIQLHPLVCTAFNADFDGDQMAVHVPLSVEAQVEARVLMIASNNPLSPANGEPIIVPTKDMVLGLYYLTVERKQVLGEGKVFANIKEVSVAYANGQLSLHASIKVVINDYNLSGDLVNRELVSTTTGRAILAEFLPQGMPFSFFNCTIKKNNLNDLVSTVYRRCGIDATVDLCDNLMKVGFKYASKAGISISVFDMIVPKEKVKIIDQAEQEMRTVRKQYTNGLLTEDERYNKSVDLWDKVSERIANLMMDEISHEVVHDKHGKKVLGENNEEKLQSSFNPIFMMADSGARGSRAQIKQISGMRGLMTNPSGKIIETPIKANFREGLSVLEYFTSTHGARKGLADTALKTANSGYLTRRLVDVAQDLIVREEDCHTDQGLPKRSILSGGEVVVPLEQRILGRVLAKDIKFPQTEKILFPAGTYITENEAKQISELGVEEALVRSAVTCALRRGVCRKCYGRDLGRGQLVAMGEAVGVIAAQSIGEPGTQLTMRTFHIGGAASRMVAARVVEAVTDGQIRISNVRHLINRQGQIVVISRSGELSVLDKNGLERERYRIQYGTVLKVKDKDSVKIGQVLAERDPLILPIIAEYQGIAQLSNIEFGVNAREQVDELTGLKSLIITAAKRASQKKAKIPTISFIDEKTGSLVMAQGTDSPVTITLRAGMTLLINQAQKVKLGDILATSPQEVGKSRDITGGLPRVAELFEIRKPKEETALASATGIVNLRGIVRNKQHLVIIDKQGQEWEHQIPKDRAILVQDGSEVKQGEELIEGELSASEVLSTRGVTDFANYIVDDVQDVYRLQGVLINDKHIEVIVKQMLRCVMITDAGDSELVVGEQEEHVRVIEINDKLLADGKREVKYEKIVLGITKASLSTESFISAASFQDTTRVLTEAAVAHKQDRLIGLKENVIVGRLIPAGTGYVYYKNKQEMSMRPYASTEKEISEGLRDIGSDAEGDDANSLLTGEKAADYAIASAGLEE